MAAPESSHDMFSYYSFQDLVAPDDSDALSPYSFKGLASPDSSHDVFSPRLLEDLVAPAPELVPSPPSFFSFPSEGPAVARFSHEVFSSGSRSLEDQIKYLRGEVRIGFKSIADQITRLGNRVDNGIERSTKETNEVKEQLEASTAKHRDHVLRLSQHLDEHMEEVVDTFRQEFDKTKIQVLEKIKYNEGKLFLKRHNSAPAAFFSIEPPLRRYLHPEPFSPIVFEEDEVEYESDSVTEAKEVEAQLLALVSEADSKSLVEESLEL